MNKQFKVNHQTGVNWNVQPVKKRCPNHNTVECSNVRDKKRCLKYQRNPESLFCPYIEGVRTKYEKMILGIVDNANPEDEKDFQKYYDKIRTGLSCDPGGKAETVVMVKISKPEEWKGGGTVILRPGQPCDHPGCCSHVSHPCEGCGRTGCC